MSIYSQEKIFYVYAYLRSKKSKFGDVGTPYYIGKGKGRRVRVTTRRIKPPKNKSLVVLLFENLNEITAYQIEIFFIKLFGRIDLNTGCLRNLSDGGEGVLGLKHSPESIAKGLATRLRNGTMNTNTPESLKKSKETKIKNNTYKRANPLESINSGVATRKKNGSYIRSEKSKQQQKDTWRKKRNAGIKGPIKSPEQIAKITASRKANGSYKRTQESIDKQLKTYYENKKEREELNDSRKFNTCH